MSRLLPALVLLAACNTDADPVQAPTLDPTMTGGLTEADHVEVSPGVFLVKDLVDAGVVGVADTDPELAAAWERYAEAGEVPPPAAGPWGPSDYCYEYDNDSYYDSTRTGQTFGSNPSWYGSLAAISYQSGTYRSDYVSAYTYTSLSERVDSVYSYGYVYIDDRYVGYINEYGTDATYATAYASFDLNCGAFASSANVEMTTYHYFYDRTLGSMNVRSTLATSVACCP